MSTAQDIAASMRSYGTVSTSSAADALLDDDDDVHTDQGIDNESCHSHEHRQAGVKTIEAISQTWSGLSLSVAYIGIIMVAFTTSLQGQVTSPIQAYATSAFGYHSLISTIMTVQETFLAVVKPIMAKVSDVFGRLESFAIAIALFVLGNVMLAGAPNIATLSAAQLFYSAGSTGLQMLQQIFIADTSDLLNRALFSAIPDLPFLITVWIGSPIAQSIVEHSTWRWGYGIWAIVLPVAFLPLALSLYVNQKKAKKLGLLPQSPFKGKSARQILQKLWYQLDFFGLVLLSAALCLILVPLTVAGSTKEGWNNDGIIISLFCGCVCLVVFPCWERSPRFAPHAFIPRDLTKNRTVLAGGALAFFYFMAFYLSVQPYFYSYLLVVPHESITAAGHITQVFSFSSTCAAVVVSLLIKYTAHYKSFTVLGLCIYMMGIGAMIVYRTPDSTTAALVACQIAVGVGGGIANISAQLGVQASVTHQQVAAVTALFLTLLEIGGAAGSAISGAIWSYSIPRKLNQYLPPETRDQAPLIYGNITLAADGWPQGSPTQLAISRAYQETMHSLLVVAVGVCLPLIPLALTMKNFKLDQIDQKVAGRVVGGNANTTGRSEAENTGTRRTNETTRLRESPFLHRKRSFSS